MLHDMKHTKGFDFNNGKVLPDTKPQLGLSEQSAAKWFQIIKAAAQVVKLQAPGDLLPSKFIDHAVKLLGYTFRNLEDVEVLQEESFQGIISSLSKCANSSKKLVAKGVGCPPKVKVFTLYGISKKLSINQHLSSGKSTCPPQTVETKATIYTNYRQRRTLSIVTTKTLLWQLLGA